MSAKDSRAFNATGATGATKKPFVFVTAPTVPEQTQKALSEGGAELAFMPIPVSENALISAFSTRRIDAVLARGSPPFKPSVFEVATDLKIISKLGAGIDSIDVRSATAHGVAVMMASGGNADAVAEHALTLMLCVSREIPRFHARLQAGIWKDLEYVVRDFRERTVGIVGYGQIGRRTAKLAAACGASVIVHSRTRVELPEGMAWEDTLDGLLARADIVSLHTRLEPRTTGFIGERELKLMKPRSIVINTARGPLIDEPALIAALKRGQLAGAGLDTYAIEPLPAGSPLLSLPNVICTPHIASTTTGSEAKLGTIASSNILYYLRGEIYDREYFVNPEVYGRS